jgi:hypothetical protein
MDWSDYYKERYDATRDELNEMHFAFGWIQGSLRILSDMIEKGDITTDPYSMEKLKKVANCLETAKEEARLNTIRTNAQMEENSKVTN